MPKPSPVRILIIEGVTPVHRVVGRCIGIFLQRRGYQTKAVYSCREAVTELRRFKPHVVIIELLLDEMEGPELARRLRELNPKAGFVLYGGHELLIEGYNRGEELGDTFMILQKPIRPKALLAEIERVACGRTEIYRV